MHQSSLQQKYLIPDIVSPCQALAQLSFVWVCNGIWMGMYGLAHTMPAWAQAYPAWDPCRICMGQPIWGPNMIWLGQPMLNPHGIWLCQPIRGPYGILWQYCSLRYTKLMCWNKTTTLIYRGFLQLACPISHYPAYIWSWFDNAITHLEYFHLDMSTKYNVFSFMFQCQNTLIIGEFDILINNTCTDLHYVTIWLGYTGNLVPSSPMPT